MTPNPLYLALLAAQREAATAPLDGHNEHHGYKYTRSRTLTLVGTDVLNRHGLALVPMGCELIPHPRKLSVPTNAGMVDIELTAYELTRTVSLIHESGHAATWAVSWPIDTQKGKRPRDKAVAAANTLLLGSVYQDLLSLRSGEEPVEDTGERERVQERPAARGRPAPAPSPRGGPRTPDSAPPRLSQDEPRATRFAMALGATPGDNGHVTGGAPGALVDLPADPGQDDLEGAGWPQTMAEELAALPREKLVRRAVVNALTRHVAKERQLTGAQVKAVIGPAFESVGVDVKTKTPPNGYQLRLWAVRVLVADEVPF